MINVAEHQRWYQVADPPVSAVSSEAFFVWKGMKTGSHYSSRNEVRSCNSAGGVFYV